MLQRNELHGACKISPHGTENLLHGTDPPPPMEELLDLLLQAPLFHGCDRSLVQRFLSHTPHRVRHKEAEEHIAYMGDRLDDIVILLQGSIYTHMHREEDEREIIVETLTGPLVLAPAFVYLPQNRLPVGVIARTPCRLLYIDRHAFSRLLHQDETLMMNYLRILSERCHRLSQKVNAMALQSLRERVLAYLDEHRRIDNVAWLARVMGVARPSLSRVLGELKQEGLIRRTTDGIERITS